MESKLVRSIFWALIGIFVVVVCLFAIPAAGRLLTGLLFLITAGAVLFLLGGALIFLTVKQKVSGMLKKFLLLTGASAVGIPVFAVLHNVVYMLGMMWFGRSAWGNGDEPVFFIMALVVCPLGFLVGAVGSIVLATKEHRLQSSS